MVTALRLLSMFTLSHRQTTRTGCTDYTFHLVTGGDNGLLLPVLRHPLTITLIRTQEVRVSIKWSIESLKKIEITDDPLSSGHGNPPTNYQQSYNQGPPGAHYQPPGPQHGQPYFQVRHPVFIFAYISSYPWSGGR